MSDRLLRQIQRLATNTRANIAMTTALCAVPLFGIMGFAIDYGIVLSNKTKLDAAADAAAVAAVTQAKAVLNSGGTITAAEAAGTAQGNASFASNSGHLAFQSSQGAVTPLIDWSGSTNQTLNVKVGYTMQSQSQFGGLFNISSSGVAGSSSSSTLVVPYYQFIFVVDISGSMAIGGTPYDINGLVSDRNIQCAFACHDPKGYRGPDYRAIAHNDGWTLKIDYVNTAVQNFISDLSSQIKSGGLAGVFSVGIDTFATTFNVALAPTTDLPGQATAQAQQIDVEPMMPLLQSQGYTTTTTSLQQALAAVTNIGDGSGPTKQMTYFILVSDGVEDIEGNLIYGRGTDVSYTTACSQIKAAGATMITIAAPYPVITNDPQQYPILVAPLAPPAKPNYQSAMAACSTGYGSAVPAPWAYSATDGPGINAAVQTALQNILKGMTRLTN